MRYSSSILVSGMLCLASPVLSAVASSPLGGSLQQRANSCQKDYSVCAPSGAATTNVPKVGDDSFRQLFVDLVGTGLPDGNSKKIRSLEHEAQMLSSRGTASLCCESSMLCYNMNGLNIPFCYDKFTTNFFLPDGSYGTLYFGTYTASNGDTANLITGDYTLKSGEKGNVYTANAAAKPNTSTMTIPSQFTGKGVGSAIPASVLGGQATVVYTNIIQPTTIAATTISASVSMITAGGVVSTTTIPATTITATTKSKSTVVVTATVAAADASSVISSASAAATANGDAGMRRRPVWEVIVGGAVIGGALVL